MARLATGPRRGRMEHPMAWIDRAHLPALKDDWRYARMINLSRRLWEATMPACGNCSGRTIAVRAPDGNEATLDGEECGGTGEALADNEDNGRADGGR